ncbi:hypothetical protein [Seonamhaeicola sp. ML3]|uniref:hypothetical protein n=1 Tax=Seonamhaeicola sp. ML3 TaxID=2937786 RepID=UPI00200EDF18|nr:hypothetical protein [Seonamhaeicola sp. ML3]
MVKNIILLLIILTPLSYNLNEKPKIDNDYFLIGTLRDYMGREKYKDIEERVDKYYKSEKKLCNSIDSMFKNKYTDLKLSSLKYKVSKQRVFELHSKTLCKRIESFYTYEPSGRGTFTGDMAFKKINFDTIADLPNFIKTHYDTIYQGNLRPEKFNTEIQKLSFVTGAYVRYGWKKDSLYQISVANSTSKVKLLDTLLKELGCDDVNYEMRMAIPASHKVSFKPTNQLKAYFKAYKPLK